MELAKVVGSVWATKKDNRLNGLKLLVIKVLASETKEVDNWIVGADTVGAGVDDIVLICRGSSARNALSNMQAPVDVAIVGIIDTVEVERSGETNE